MLILLDVAQVVQQYSILQLPVRMGIILEIVAVIATVSASNILSCLTNLSQWWVT